MRLTEIRIAGFGGQGVILAAALTKTGEILVGKFVDRERPDYIETMRAQFIETLGDRYVQAEVPLCV